MPLGQPNINTGNIKGEEDMSAELIHVITGGLQGIENELQGVCTTTDRIGTELAELVRIGHDHLRALEDIAGNLKTLCQILDNR